MHGGGGNTGQKRLHTASEIDLVVGLPNGFGVGRSSKNFNVPIRVCTVSGVAIDGGIIAEYFGLCPCAVDPA